MSQSQSQQQQRTLLVESPSSAVNKSAPPTPSKLKKHALVESVDAAEIGAPQSDAVTVPDKVHRSAPLEAGENQCNVDGDGADNKRADAGDNTPSGKKAKTGGDKTDDDDADEAPLAAAAVDVEAAKDAFVERAAVATSDGLAIKEQSEATLDKLNAVHFDMVVSTNSLLAAVDPALNGELEAARAELVRIEEKTAALINADQAQPASSDAQPAAEETQAAAATEEPQAVAAE